MAKRNILTESFSAFVVLNFPFHLMPSLSSPKRRQITDDSFTGTIFSSFFVIFESLTAELSKKKIFPIFYSEK